MKKFLLLALTSFSFLSTSISQDVSGKEELTLNSEQKQDVKIHSIGVFDEEIRIKQGDFVKSYYSNHPSVGTIHKYWISDRDKLVLNPCEDPTRPQEEEDKTIEPRGPQRTGGNGSETTVEAPKPQPTGGDKHSGYFYFKALKKGTVTLNLTEYYRGDVKHDQNVKIIVE